MRVFLFAVLFLTVPWKAVAQEVSDDAVAALAARDAGWDIAQAMAADVDDLTVSVLTWLRLRTGEAEIVEYGRFLDAHSDWPGTRQLRTAAERVIDPAYPAEDVIAWFADTPPLTGEGAVHYAAALSELGQDDRALDVLRDAWVTLRLDETGFQAMSDAYEETLRPFHAARVDALLWRSRRNEVEWMLDLLDPEEAALAAARLAYVRGASDIAQRVQAVPSNLTDAPGLAYARYDWLARRGERTEAVQILLDRSTSRAALAEPFRWSGWRRVLARWEMREGRAEQAYTLSSRHYLDDGAPYADLEWLAGYIALTYLGDPPTALTHLENALRVSNGSISVARAQYWIGRAWEVKGDIEAAAAAYSAAAGHQTAFYGLLASEKIGRALDVSIVAPAADWGGAEVFQNDVVRAALLLLAADERGAAFTFFVHIGRSFEPEDLDALGAYLNAIDEERFALLLGKSMAARGVILPELYFPVHDLAEMDLPTDPALALSIARRESEFNPEIGSPVGALGLMQLMPPTAEEVAGWLNLPYSRARLTADWEYNATLGAAYLEFLTKEFGPTPVMIAAGYNAGPSRPRQWIDARGDPRLREMDVVDWIEHIPFRETRNYVMRVTESLPIYQARLSGRVGPVQFTELLIGSKPVLRPVARPTR